MVSLAWPRWRKKSGCSSGNPGAEEHRAEPRGDFGRAGCEEAAHPLLGDFVADKQNYSAVPVSCRGTLCARAAAVPFSVGSGCYGVMFTEEPVSVRRNPLHHPQNHPIFLRLLFCSLKPISASCWFPWYSSSILVTEKRILFAVLCIGLAAAGVVVHP